MKIGSTNKLKTYGLQNEEGKIVEYFRTWNAAKSMRVYYEKLHDQGKLEIVKVK